MKKPISRDKSNCLNQKENILQNYKQKYRNLGYSESQICEIMGQIGRNILDIDAYKVIQEKKNNVTNQNEQPITNRDMTIKNFKGNADFSFETTDIEHGKGDPTKMLDVSFHINSAANRPDVLEISVKNEVYRHRFRMTKAYVKMLLEHITHMEKIMNHEDFEANDDE